MVPSVKAMVAVRCISRPLAEQLAARGLHEAGLHLDGDHAHVRRFSRCARPVAMATSSSVMQAPPCVTPKS
jgi:hypothetical protein